MVAGDPLKEEKIHKSPYVSYTEKNEQMLVFWKHKMVDTSRKGSREEAKWAVACLTLKSNSNWVVEKPNYTWVDPILHAG